MTTPDFSITQCNNLLQRVETLREFYCEHYFKPKFSEDLVLEDVYDLTVSDNWMMLVLSDDEGATEYNLPTRWLFMSAGDLLKEFEAEKREYEEEEEEKRLKLLKRQREQDLDDLARLIAKYPVKAREGVSNLND